MTGEVSGVSKFVYWIKKTLNGNRKYCNSFCPACKYYEVCKNDQVLD